MGGEAVPMNYIPIAIFMVLGAGFGLVTILLGYVLRPSRPYRAKLLPYESGDVALFVATNDIAFDFEAIAQHDTHLFRVTNNMRIGQDETVFADRESRSMAGAQPDRDHRRQNRFDIIFDALCPQFGGIERQRLLGGGLLFGLGATQRDVSEFRV